MPLKHSCALLNKLSVIPNSILLSKTLIGRCGYGQTINGNIKRFYSSTGSANYKYDVTIVGGGMVGGSMACALGKSAVMKGKKILLLEASVSSPTSILSDVPESYSNRVCAISPGNVEFLESLNIWNQISRSAAVKKMQIWDACSDALISFDKNNMSDELCRIAENQMIIAAITNVLQGELKSLVDVRYNKKISHCTFPGVSNQKNQNNNVVITMEDGTTLETKLLIAADGANSVIVKQSGIKKLNWQYGQSAVVATLKLSEPTENFVAWQRFLPTGPIALLPLTENLSSLVWSTTAQHAEDLVKMDEDQFISHINSAFWQSYPQSDLVLKTRNFLQSVLPDDLTVMQFPPSISGLESKHEKFPLGFSHLNRYVKPGLAVIGDACHRIHPLAGQGVNLGLRDVRCLTSVLNNAVYDGEHLGSLDRLLVYEKKRQAANLPIATIVDVLQRLYSTDNNAVVMLRTMGLKCTNAIKPIKDFLMEEAVK